MLPMAIKPRRSARAFLAVQRMRSSAVLLVIFEPQTVVFVLVSAATSLEILRAHLHSFLSLLKRRSNGLSSQKVAVKLPRKQFADLIHDFLVRVNRNNYGDASFKKDFTDFLALTCAHKCKFYLVLLCFYAAVIRNLEELGKPAL